VTKSKRAKAVARNVIGQPPARRVEVPRTKRPPKHKKREDE
jgi:hypothetical protein